VHTLQLQTNLNFQHVPVSEEGVTKTFTCARTLIGQHVFLQLVGVEGSLSVCEVEVFTTDGKNPSYICGSLHHAEELGYLSRYSDWLRAGQQRGRSSSPGKVKNFLFSTSSRPVLWPTQPPVQSVSGSCSPEIKRPGREADHSPPTSTEVKNTWIYTSTFPYAVVD
jgi:hypothetical protein